jgi:hypothetical protein
LRKSLSAERARELLAYDPETGVLRWRKVRFGGASAGQVAGHINKSGYCRIVVDGGSHLAHRLAWLITYGEWPRMLDHVNGDRADNRLVNLRECNATQNSCNAKTLSRHGRGVSLRGGKWTAAIRASRQLYWLGTFDTKEQAAAAYRNAAKQLHGEFARYD